MKSALLTSVSLAALVAFSGQALSADAYYPSSSKDAPAAERAASWSGPWIGIAGGYTFFNSELDYFEDKGETYETHANINGLGAEGLFGELQAGYDHQINSNFVVGIFGGVNLSDAEFEASYSSHGVEAVNVTTDYEWGGVLGARLGMLKGPDTLFYVGGGWAFAQLGDTEISVLGKPGVSIDGPDLSGWFAEVGAEHRIRDNLYLTVAGRYTDYGVETLWSNDSEHCPKEVEIDTDNLAVMVGLKAKLGGIGF